MCCAPLPWPGCSILSLDLQVLIKKGTAGDILECFFSAFFISLMPIFVYCSALLFILCSNQKTGISL
jgi:hypothetical protein